MNKNTKETLNGLTQKPTEVRTSNSREMSRRRALVLLLGGAATLGVAAAGADNVINSGRVAAAKLDADATPTPEITSAPEHAFEQALFEMIEKLKNDPRKLNEVLLDLRKGVAGMPMSIEDTQFIQTTFVADSPYGQVSWILEARSTSKSKVMEMAGSKMGGKDGGGALEFNALVEDVEANSLAVYEREIRTINRKVTVNLTPENVDKIKEGDKENKALNRLKTGEYTATIKVKFGDLIKEDGRRFYRREAEVILENGVDRSITITFFDLSTPVEEKDGKVVFTAPKAGAFDAWDYFQTIPTTAVK